MTGRLGAKFSIRTYLSDEAISEAQVRHQRPLWPDAWRELTLDPAHAQEIEMPKRRRRPILRRIINIADLFLAPEIRYNADLVRLNAHRSLAIQSMALLVGVPVIVLFYFFNGWPNTFETLGLALFALAPVIGLSALRFSANAQLTAMTKVCFTLGGQYFLCFGSGGLLSVFASLPPLIQASASVYGNSRLIASAAIGSIGSYTLLFGLQMHGMIPNSLPLPGNVLIVSYGCLLMVAFGLYLIALDGIRAQNIPLRQLYQARREYVALAEVLRITSRSDYSLDQVLRMLVEASRALCLAPFGALYLVDNNVLVPGAVCCSVDPACEAEQQYRLIAIDEHSAAGRAILSRNHILIGDVFSEGGSFDIENHARTGLRALLAVPLMRDGKAIGAMVFGRPLTRRFTRHEVDLVTSFGDQAVIAIENHQRLEMSASMQSSANR